MSTTDAEFQRVVMEGLVPKIEGSAICVAIAPSTPDKIDAKFCVELGAMIMLNKPIIAIMPPGSNLPPKLALVADHVIRVDITTEEGRTALAKELGDITTNLAETGELHG